MEENEKKQEQAQEAPTGGYQPNFRPQPGRSPRPRIHQPRPYTNTGSGSQYKTQQGEEGGFRPEGFGTALQGTAQQRPAYRPRNTYNNEGGYGRPQQNNAYGRPQQGGYGRPQGQGGYGRPQGQGGYGRSQGQGGYGRPQGQGGYGRPQQGGYGRPQQGGYGRPQQGFRKHTPGYDPNAKYSLKKRIEYKEENFDPNEPIRLNKFLANAGVCSRREADEYIQAGVITVNGEVVTELGTKVLRTDEIKFHDQPVSLEKKVYVLLNKPKDYVTTSDDPQQRKTVMDLVKNCCKERIYPVGRLDRNTTGVLLLTNDGDMASKLTHPKFLKKKIYHVYLDKNVTAHDIQQIRDGITLEDGDIKADACEYADPVDKKQVGIEIHSGKNRIVRRIFEHLGYKVTKLDRVQFAGLTKKNLRRGDWRYLTEEEVDRLRMGAYE